MNEPGKVSVCSALQEPMKKITSLLKCKNTCNKSLHLRNKHVGNCSLLSLGIVSLSQETRLPDFLAVNS